MIFKKDTIKEKGMTNVWWLSWWTVVFLFARHQAELFQAHLLDKMAVKYVLEPVEIEN